MKLTSKDLMIHKAQIETIEERIYVLAKEDNINAPRGHYKPEYFIEEYDIEDGCIRVRFYDPRAMDEKYVRYTFDRLLGNEPLTLVEAGGHLRGAC